MSITVGLPGGITTASTTAGSVLTANSGSFTVSQSSITFPWYIDATNSVNSFWFNLFVKTVSTNSFAYGSNKLLAGTDTASTYADPYAILKIGTGFSSNSAGGSTPNASIDATLLSPDTQYKIQWSADNTTQPITASPNAQYFGYSVSTFWTYPASASLGSMSQTTFVPGQSFTITVPVSNASASNSLLVFGNSFSITSYSYSNGTITINGIAPSVIQTYTNDISINFINTGATSGYQTTASQQYTLSVMPLPPTWSSDPVNSLYTPTLGVAYYAQATATSTTGSVTYSFAPTVLTAYVSGQIGATSVTVNSGNVFVGALLGSTSNYPAGTTVLSVTTQNGTTTMTTSSGLLRARSNQSITVTSPTTFPLGISNVGNTVQGTTTQIGSFYFTVTASDSYGQSISSNISWVLKGGGRRMTSATVASSLTTAKRYNGSSWVDITVRKRYNGSSWVDITN